MVPVALGLAIASFLAGARLDVRTRATLDTAGPAFVVLLVGVILIVGALVFVPTLNPGPIGERIVSSA